MITYDRLWITLTAGVVLPSAFAFPAEGAGSAFTYQGQLKRGGVPVNEAVDFKFFLMDEFVLPIGPEIQLDNVNVVAGLFNAELDFGFGWFSGNNRFLEIWVRVPAGNGQFQQLSPVQPIRPAPYALFALDGNEGPPGPPGDSHWQIDGVTTSYTQGNVGIGTPSVAPNARLHVSGDLRISEGNIRVRTEGFDPHIELTSDDALDSTSMFLKTVDSVGFMVTDNFETNHPLFVVHHSGNVGIGTTIPSARLSVAGTVESTVGGFRFPDGTVQSSAAIGGTGDGHSLDASDGSPADALMVDNAGKVGVGTSTPLATQHVRNALISLPTAALESDDLIIESRDAVLGLYSDDGGGFGSAIALKEIGPAGLVDSWGMVRMTDGSGSALRFTYGPSDQYWANPTRVEFESDGNVGIGTTVPATSLHVNGNADLSGSSDFISGGHLTLSSANSVFDMVLDGNEIQTRHGNDAEDPQNAVFLNDRGGNVHLARNGRVAVGTSTPAARLHVQADASIAPTALLVAGVPGNDSVILPVNSIGSEELASEPGIASDFESGVSLSADQVVTVCDRKITCPVDGFIVAIATAYFGGPTGPPGSSDRIILGITTSLGPIPTAQRHFHDLGDFAELNTITVHEVIPVSSGETTVRFRVEDGQNIAQNARLTVMFFPTAYGIVDIP